MLELDVLTWLDVYLFDKITVGAKHAFKVSPKEESTEKFLSLASLMIPYICQHVETMVDSNKNENTVETVGNSDDRFDDRLWQICRDMLQRWRGLALHFLNSDVLGDTSTFLCGVYLVDWLVRSGVCTGLVVESSGRRVGGGVRTLLGKGRGDRMRGAKRRERGAEGEGGSDLIEVNDK